MTLVAPSCRESDLGVCSATACAPQKVDPALIARFRPAMVGCFWPIFFLRITRGVCSSLFPVESPGLAFCGGCVSTASVCRFVCPVSPQK